MNTILTLANVSEAESSLGLPIFFLLLAILAKAFFAVSEISIVSLNDAKMRRDAENGTKEEKILRGFIDEPSKFLATIQVGVTLVGLLASAFAAVVLAEPLAKAISVALEDKYPSNIIYNLCIFAVTIVLAFLMLVFGELVPKRLAAKNSDIISKTVATPLRTISIILFPFVKLSNLFTNLTLRAFGVDPNEDQQKVSEEEIRMMVDIAEEKDAIDPEEKQMIENVFEFNDTVASEIMVHRKDIVAIPMDATEEECKNIIRSSQFSRIPVYENSIDDIKGILNSRDFLLKCLDQEHVDFQGMLRKPVFVPETISADVLFSQMQKNKLSMAIVLDEYGGTSGLVTLEDLLEEIVGEIYDEYDKPEDENLITELPDGTYRVSGEMGLEEVIDQLGLPSPDEEDDFNTFAGFVFDRIKTVPNVGAKVMLPKLHVEAMVEEMDGNRIDKIIVRKISPEKTTPVEEDEG